jgi:hypothetical protein
MANAFGESTVARWLAEQHLDHLQVLTRGAHLVVYSEEDGAKWNRIRFTHLGGQGYLLAIADHRGRWEDTPFTGSLPELLHLVATDFAWVLTDA